MQKGVSQGKKDFEVYGGTWEKKEAKKKSFSDSLREGSWTF